jgi:hypothetical protein
MWRRLFLVVAAIGCSGNDHDGGGGDTVTVTAALAPAAVIAYRDGDGAWITKTGAETPFSFNVSSGTYTVAIGCKENVFYRVDVYQLTIDDLQNLDYGRECGATTTMISGQVLGNAMTGNRMAWGQEANAYWTANEPTYTLPTAAGRHDLIATRGVLAPDRAVIVRDIEVPPDQQVDVDFEGPDAVAIEYRAITGCDVQPAFASVGGTFLLLGLDAAQDMAATVPTAAMHDGDLNLFHCSYERLMSGGVSQFVSTTRAGREAPAALDLSPFINDVPAVWRTVAGEHELLHASWVPQPGASLYEISAGVWIAHVSPAIFESTATFDLPDVSSAPGWDPTLTLKYGSQTVDWGVHIVTGAPLDELLRPFPSREGEVRIVGWVGDNAEIQ